MLFTLDHGAEGLDVGGANRSGQMDQYMKGIGKIIQLMDKVD
jgi:hypothetical protein